MENVVAFNNELSGLYDSKPPISKAKMASITKAAMRAIKFYKHVVQSVEKFILKCKPEYKVPGLYVIDSIVRQSRHQFGVEKDVFAPRFARNIKETFANLFRCAPEDKSRIIRVLNLWQKNNVFAPDVIQPIFDLADPNHPIYQMQATNISTNATLNDITTSSNGMNNSIGGVMDISTMQPPPSGGSNIGEEKSLPDLSIGQQMAQNVLDQSTIRQLQQIQQILIRKTTASSSNSGPSSTGTGVAMMSSSSSSSCMLPNINNISNIRGNTKKQGNDDKLTSIMSNSATASAIINQSETLNKFNKNLLDFDYDEEDDTDDKSSSPNVSNILDKNNLKQLLKDPNVLLQLQTLQNFQKFKQQQEEKQIKLNEMRLQEEAFEKHLQNVLKGAGQLGGPGGVGGIQAIDSVDLSSKEVEFVSEESKIEVINLDGNDSRSPSPTERADRYAANKRRRSRSRSRSRDRANGRDRDNRRRRSRSRSRSSRSPRSNRRRTSRDRERNKNDAREKEKEKDRERDRRRKGIPDIKKGHLSVCSTTLWVGHLSKLVYQEELSDTFGKYGDIVSIDQIVPRGCAFIVMNRRQDANKAMQSLKSYKLQGRAITISWAAGKGVKSKEWKDFWDLELGVTYIPWDKLDENTDLDSLEEGGMFDEDSMPSWMVEKINKLKSIKDNVVTGGIVLSSDNLPNIDMTQPPPGPPPEGMMSMVPPQFSIAPPLGAPPRLMNPMGVPMPGNMVSGIPMPPNMVPGMPPPHPMMMPPGMLPPGFPPLGQMEKNPPPPIMRNDVGSQNSLAAALGTAAGHFMGNHGMLAQMSGPPPMNMPPNQNQFQPPPNFASGQNNTSDDQMDIEMDIEDQTPAPPQVSFTQPPPMFPGAFLPPRPDGSNDGDGDHHEDFGNRDRNRNDRGGSSSSRWGSGGRNDDIGNGDRSVRDGGDGNMDAAPSIWQENNGGFSGGPNFNDSRNGGHGVGPMNLPPPPHDMINPDFFDVRDKFNDNNRRGGGGGGGGPRNVGPPPNGDFFGNIQNRFGQPTSLMQMRIAPPPPNPFNTRMGGPGGPGNQMMFMRGPGGHGGGRHQGPGGFNFNDRPPFERDGHDGMMGGGGGGNRGNDRRGGRRGGGRVGGGGGGGSGNWRDNDDEDGGGMNFRRRGQGGGGGNRFRDGYDDRRSRDKDRMGNRRGGNDRNSRDRDRDRRDNDRNRGGYRRSSPQDNSSNRFNDKQPQVAIDTEEDWDEELSEHSFGEGTSRTGTSVTQENDSGEFSDTKESAPQTETDVKTNSDGNTTVNNFRLSPEQNQDQSDSKKSEQPQNVNTPLYDEPSSAPNAPSPAKDFESQSEQLISISTTNSETNPAEVTGSEATNE